MFYKLIEARYVRDYVIHIKFDDGMEGDIDLKNELDGAVFEPLKDMGRFKSFRVHPELYTLVWDNDADFAPEFLREKIQVPA